MTCAIEARMEFDSIKFEANRTSTREADEIGTAKIYVPGAERKKKKLS